MKDSHNILNPCKFSLFIIQVILTINVAFTKDDNIYSQISYMSNSNSIEYINSYNSIVICLLLFYIFQIIEVIFIFIGESIFLNKINLLIIFFHAINIALLSSFILESKESNYLWKLLVIGSIIPVLLEVIGIIYERQSNKAAHDYSN